mmetsp:Transcript_90774/g.280725  ORF Transcript_90774/g.280725 Transcript_90774/m.280725 type:complete len:263 (+) Transcript_90774:718-1506(+)
MRGWLSSATTQISPNSSAAALLPPSRPPPHAPGCRAFTTTSRPRSVPRCTTANSPRLMHSPSSMSVKRRIFWGASRRLKASAVAASESRGGCPRLYFSSEGSEASREGPGLEGAAVEEVPTSVGPVSGLQVSTALLSELSISARARGVTTAFGAPAGSKPQAAEYRRTTEACFGVRSTSPILGGSPDTIRPTASEGTCRHWPLRERLLVPAAQGAPRSASAFRKHGCIAWAFSKCSCAMASRPGRSPWPDSAMRRQWCATQR